MPSTVALPLWWTIQSNNTVRRATKPSVAIEFASLLRSFPLAERSARYKYALVLHIHYPFDHACLCPWRYYPSFVMQG